MTTTTSGSSSAQIVHQLADLFRTNGHRVLQGDSKVCFTSDSLTLLSHYFQAAKLDIASPLIDGRARSSSIPPPPPPPPTQNLRINPKLKDDLIFLHDFLHKTVAVKLIHNLPTLQGNVHLYPFQSVICLELKKIPPHMLLGLSALRHQLETLICSQSVTNIEDLLSDCGGDSANVQIWPRLKVLFLSHNFIERIDQSLKFLVALEVLDLSHNRLQDCSSILDVIPHLQHLNLSSNLLRIVPIWSGNRGDCRLLTLKMRQNCIEEIVGIETMNSIEELDFGDNFMTNIPEQIRSMTHLKRLYFIRNPFTYDPNYRKMIVANLPFVFSQEARSLIIDDRPLTTKEKQMIPRTRPPPRNLAPGFSLYSASTSATHTVSESTTEPESVVTNSTGTIISRRRPRRKARHRYPLSTDNDDTPTEHATSGSETEPVAQKQHLEKLKESRQRYGQNWLLTQSNMDLNIPNEGNSPTILDEEETISETQTHSIATSIPHIRVSDIAQSPKRKKSPRVRRSGALNQIVLTLVDDGDNTATGQETPTPDSPPPESSTSIYNNFPSPSPVLPITTVYDENQFTTGGIEIHSLRTIFFVTTQTNATSSSVFVDDENLHLLRPLTIEIGAMHLIEKENDSEESTDMLKYSSITLVPNSEREKTVELTVEKRRGELERRVYIFDTVHDHKAFVEEVERHLQSSSPIQLESVQFPLSECSQCGNSFPRLSTDNPPSNICGHCQKLPSPPAEPPNNSSLSTPVLEESINETALDHRLHLHLAVDHFSHDREQIKMHFKCFVVHSTTNTCFIAQTILTDYGIYVFRHEPLKERSDENVELEYILVGKDHLTNVLMIDVGYRQQTFTVEFQSGAFAFLLADPQKTQTCVNGFLEVLAPFVQRGESALQKISRISSDEYRQRLFDIIKQECNIDEPAEDMIDFYSIMIRVDQAGNSLMIGLLLLRNWILMIEDAYATIDSRHVRLPAQQSSEINHQFKCDLMHLVNVTNFFNRPKLFLFDYVDESETKTFRWKLESLIVANKNEFLERVRKAYEIFMHIPLPETLETA